MDQNQSNNPPYHQMISVIIPVFNVANTLGEQLDALKKQNYDGEWEIIVVDNGSVDNTVDIVKEYQRYMPRLRLVSAVEKQGASYARNAGASVAQGDRLVFCDGDDIVAPGWLAALAQALQEHCLVVGAVEIKTLNEKDSNSASYSQVGTKYIHLDFMPYAITCNTAVSREAFDAVGGFSEDFLRCQDVDFSWRLQLYGYKLHDAPDAVVYYRYRQTTREFWQQMVGVGEAQVHLYKRFAPYGMPRASARNVWGRYKSVIKKTSVLWRDDQAARRNWIYLVASYLGRLRGSIRYRTFYL